jgi:hypothetical protein
VLQAIEGRFHVAEPERAHRSRQVEDDATARRTPRRCGSVITSDVARSVEQSDFSIVRMPDVELPDSAAPMELPGAPRSNEAGELVTRWVMRIALVLLAALFVLCAVGPHIPSGE